MKVKKKRNKTETAADAITDRLNQFDVTKQTYL